MLPPSPKGLGFRTVNRMNKHIKFSFLTSILLTLNIPLVASESYYVSSHGYFIGDSEHVTDWKLADAIVDFLRKEKAETLVDFGCGDGDYVNHLIKILIIAYLAPGCAHA